MKRNLYDNASIKLPSNNPADAADPIEYTLQHVKDGDVWIKFNPDVDSVDQLNELLDHLFPGHSYALGNSMFYTADGNGSWLCYDRYQAGITEHYYDFETFYAIYQDEINQKLK